MTSDNTTVAQTVMSVESMFSVLGGVSSLAVQQRAVFSFLVCGTFYLQGNTTVPGTCTRHSIRCTGTGNS